MFVLFTDIMVPPKYCFKFRFNIALNKFANVFANAQPYTTLCLVK